MTSKLPRKTSWGGARASVEILNMARSKAKAKGISLADYLERLVISDFVSSDSPDSKP